MNKKMNKELRILLLEDLPTDAELIQHELQRANLAFTTRRVETEKEFTAALGQFRPDLILADYSLPTFDGMTALSLAQEQCSDVPFIFVSGSIGEERAIRSLKRGASDYVLKDALKRLVPAVEAALRETEERTARRLAEQALRESEQRHRALLDINNAIARNLAGDALVDAIAQSLNQVHELDVVCLILIEEGGFIVTACAEPANEQSLMPALDRVPFPKDDRYLTRVIESKGLVDHELRRTGEGGFLAVLAQTGIKTCVAVPLPSETRVLGVLCVGSRVESYFSPKDREFLVGIGRQVSLAVQNMVAYQEIADLKASLERENQYLQEEIGTDHNFSDIVGNSESLRVVLQTLKTVAPTTASVLITGQTGTGKELIARAIHTLSSRKDKPLIKVNCASIPRELFESEFFGHVKGAFTGAIKTRVGRFELADGGTLFSDEVCEIPLELQSKLLRVLQEGEFERVGEERTRQVNVRLIAATNRDPLEEIQNGRFREDLFFRLNVVPITVPPLRDRGEDVTLLAEHFLARACKEFNRGPFKLASQQKNALRRYGWPGNVRELRNVIERAVALSTDELIELDYLLASPTDKNASAEEGGFLTAEEFRVREKANITAALEVAGWRIAGAGGAAELLGVPASTLANRLRSLGISKPSATH